MHILGSCVAKHKLPWLCKYKESKAKEGAEFIFIICIYSRNWEEDELQEDQPEKERKVFSFTLFVLSWSATFWTVVKPSSSVYGFARQECWSGLLFSSPGDLPDPGMEPASPSLAGRLFTTEPPEKSCFPLIEPQFSRAARKQLQFFF